MAARFLDRPHKAGVAMMFMADDKSPMRSLKTDIVSQMSASVHQSPSCAIE
jgi:hypothetical protein